MGKYYKTYTVKPLPPFNGYNNFLQFPWRETSVKRVAWLIYPALRDIQLQVTAIQSLTGQEVSGAIIWERTKGKMYAFVVRDNTHQSNLRFFQWKFNSDFLRRLRLSAGIVKALRPLDTWVFLIQSAGLSVWGTSDWVANKTALIDSPAIGYWVSRGLLRSERLPDDSPGFITKRPMNFGCFKDNVYHHGSWHTGDPTNVWRKRWIDEHPTNYQTNS